MSIDGTANDDSLTGAGGNDVINGFDGDDQLRGYGGSDTLNGGNDNDYLDGGTGTDVLNGGNGDDYAIADVGDSINGGTGSDTAYIDLSSLGTNIVKALDFTAGVSNNLSNGTKFQNIDVLDLVTGSGNDSISYDSSAIFGSNPQGHYSYWYGGGGDDHATVDWSDQSFDVSATSSVATIGGISIAFQAIERFDYYGGNGDDGLAGATEADKLVGNDGSDILTGLGGNDTLDGGNGNDTIYAGNSTDNAGIDTITGGNGDDAITAAFKDVIDGGSGRDELFLDLADRGSDTSLAYDPSVSNTVASTTFQHIEQLYLTTGSGDDSLSFGSKAIQVVPSTDGRWYGGNGSDTASVDFSDQIFNVSMTVNGVQIADFSFTFSGIEVFHYTGGAGNDTIYGGANDDVLVGNAGVDGMQGGIGDDHIDSGDGRDNIYGGADDDTIDGGNDRDTISGDDGKDKITGGNGRDTLSGGLDIDDIKGGAGNDKMQGDGGKDTLDGGSENDLFIYLAPSDSTNKSYDTIDHFDFTQDRFHFNGGVGGFDGTVNSHVDNASFNADVTAATASLIAHHAMILNVNGGDISPAKFIVVDVNGAAGYQVNDDYIIKLTNIVNLGSAEVTDFQG